MPRVHVFLPQAGGNPKRGPARPAPGGSDRPFGQHGLRHALEPGDVTEALFTSVGFDPDMGNLYQKSTASVEVTAYAVQVANNGETVMDAKGWPERK